MLTTTPNNEGNVNYIRKLCIKIYLQLSRAISTVNKLKLDTCTAAYNPVSATPMQFMLQEMCVQVETPWDL